MDKSLLTDSDKLLDALASGGIDPEGMNPEDADIITHVLKELRDNGDSATMAKLYEIDYERRPPTIEEFCEDDYYLNAALKAIPEEDVVGLFPKWREVLYRDFAPGGQVQQAIFSGAIGLGKSTVGSILLLHRCAQALCLRNPLQFYGLMKASSLIFSFFSVTQKQVKGGAFQDCINLMAQSPFFKERVSKVADKKFADRRIQLVKNVVIEAGSKIHEALGRNSLVTMIDEINFRLEKDPARSAYELVEGIKRRAASRFQKAASNPYLLIICSSTREETDFLAGYIQQSRNNEKIKVYEFPWWEVTGAVKMQYSGETFRVDVGDNLNLPRILRGGETCPPERLLHVPEEHRPEFERDLSGSIRDIAGRSVGRISKFFYDVVPLFNCIADDVINPMAVESVPISVGVTTPIEAHVDLDKMAVRRGQQMIPLINPFAPRFIHMDMSMGGDAFGFCMLHPTHATEVGQFNPVLAVRETVTKPCFAKNERLLTTEGWRTFGELVGEDPLIIQDGRVRGYLQDGEEQWEITMKETHPVTQQAFAVQKTGENREIWRVETECGRVLRVTPDHLVATPNGMVEASRLQISDRVLVGIGHAFAANFESLDWRLGFLAGLCFGDGCFAHNKAVVLDLWESDYEVVSEVEKMVTLVLTEDGASTPFSGGTKQSNRFRVCFEKPTYTKFRLWSAHLRDVFIRNAIPTCKDNFDFLFPKSKNFKAGFLSGFFHADGHVEAASAKNLLSLRITQQDKTRLQVLMLLLQELGVFAKIYHLLPHRTTEIDGRPIRCRETWRLVVGGIDNANKMMAFMKFFGQREERLRTFLARPLKRGGYKRQPVAIIKQAAFDGKGDTYCLSEEERRTCIVGGITARRCFQIDLLFRLVRAPGSKEVLDFSMIRGFIWWLKTYVHYNIEMITADLLQLSVPVLQPLEQAGMSTKYLSVDKTKTGYLGLRQAVMEGRLRTFDHNWFFLEAQHLEDLPDKIDHPVKFPALTMLGDQPLVDLRGSKDCVGGDTEIPLLNGSRSKIRDLVGQQPWVYSCTPTGDVRAGKASRIWSKGIQPVYRVYFDNGEFLDCTADHEIMRRDGDYTEAGRLVTGVSIMPLYRKLSQANPKHGLNGYEQVLSGGKWHYTHQIVIEQFHGRIYGASRKGRRVGHHQDFNKRNNTPENLVVMGWHEHQQLHTTTGETNLKKLWQEPAFRALRHHFVVGRVEPRPQVRAGVTCLKVDYLGEQEVFDMTVEGFHNFAVGAGVFVHNCTDGVAGAIANATASEGGLNLNTAKAAQHFFKEFAEKDRTSINPDNWIVGNEYPPSETRVI